MSNLHLVKADFDEIFRGSPLEQIWKSGQVEAGSVNEDRAAMNVENLLRLPLLYRSEFIAFNDIT